jgi:Fic family protein
MYKFKISNRLLKNLKEISVKANELENKKFPHPILAKYELSANCLSAYSSTSIEGNPLPLTDVKKIIKNRPSEIRKSEQEILNYNECLMWLNLEIREDKLEFDQRLIFQIHKTVMKNLMAKSQIGKNRNEPVFVNDPKQKKTVYWPPDHQDIPDLLRELLAFVKENENELDPIILAGLFHKQFVIIHPFIDGNGRTVRLATKVLLAKLGLNTFNLFSFENYYNNNVSQYFAKVGVFGNYYDIAKKVDFTDWLEYFSDGVLDELNRVHKELETEMKGPLKTLQVHHQIILDHIQEHGYIQDKDYARKTERAKATRALDFKFLINLGYIEKHGRGPGVYYKNK